MMLRSWGCWRTGDGEADALLSAGGDDGVGVEAAVGAHRELSSGPGVAYPPHRLPAGSGPRPRTVLARPLRSRAISTSPVPAATATTAGDSPAGRCSRGRAAPSLASP